VGRREKSAWSAGIADGRHLEDLTALVGQRYVERRSTSYTRPGRAGGGGPSVTSSFDREHILSVDELAGLPQGRMVVVPVDGYPILARTVPWWERRHIAQVVADSVRTYEPGSSTPSTHRPRPAPSTTA
jgi:type IV secretory pathway TraG/TraD family ATPase VirD4